MREAPSRSRKSPPIVRRAASALACLLAIAGAAATADDPVDPDLSTRGMRPAGPFFLRPFVVLRDVGWDDNVRFDADRPSGDFTATIAPGLRALLLTGARGGLLVHQEFGYVAFRDDSELNHWNSSTRARGMALLRRAEIYVEERYDTVRERPSTEIDRRLRRSDETLSAGFLTLAGNRLRVRAAARRSRVDYAADDVDSESISRRLNRDEIAAGPGIDVRVLPKTWMTLDLSAERYDFEDPAQSRDARGGSLLPGLKFDPSASIQGSLRIGPARLRPDDASRRAFHGVVGDAALSARAGASGRMKGTFARKVSFSATEENLFYSADQWSAAYERYFSRRISGEISYGRGRNEYPVPVVVPGAGSIDRVDRTTTTQATVRLRLNDQSSVAIFAQRLVRDSSDDERDRDRNFIGFGSTLQF